MDSAEVCEPWFITLQEPRTKLCNNIASFHSFICTVVVVWNLLLYSSCSGVVLTVYSSCTDVVLLFSRCTDVLKSFSCCTDVVLKMYSCCTDTVLNLFSYCTDFVLKLFSCCTRTYLEARLSFPDSVSSLHPSV